MIAQDFHLRHIWLLWLNWCDAREKERFQLPVYWFPSYKNNANIRTNSTWFGNDDHHHDVDVDGAVDDDIYSKVVVVIIYFPLRTRF